MPIVFVLAVVLVLGAVSYGLSTREDGKTLPTVSKGWPQKIFPLNIYTETEFDSVKQAAIFWNRSIGKALFSVVDDSMADTAHQLVLVGTSDNESHPHGAAWTDVKASQGRILYAQVNLSPRFEFLTDEQKFRAMAHELGHVLGLGHDDFAESVMYSKVQSPYEPIVTAKDKALLKQLYD
jgi:hypothetical protein